MSGWIKLHRKIKDHWIFDNPDYFRAWAIMIMRANHKKKGFIINNMPITCDRGQCALSKSNWATEFGTGWTRQKVRTFFKKLEVDGMIVTSEITNTTTKLTICNYGDYQSSEPSEEPTYNQHSTNPQPTPNQPATTNKDLKNNKNEEKKKNEENNIDSSNNSNKEDYNPEDAVKDINEIDDNLWLEWIAHKKKLKLAITQRAVIKNLNKLKKFGLNKANSIIEDSIDSGWKDLYLKDEAGKNKPIQQSHNEANSALIAKAMAYGDIDI